MTPTSNEDPAPPPIPPPISQQSPQMPPTLEQGKTAANKNKSLTGSWILGLVAVGGFCCLLSVIVTKIHIGHVDTPYKTGEMVGAAIGWFLIALVVCGILALFKSFRQNPRRLAIVAIIIWALIGLGNIVQLGELLRHEATDKATADDFGREIDRLRKQATQTTDPRESAKIQSQMIDKLKESAVEHDSPSVRQLMSLLNPFLKQESAYTQKKAVAFGIGWLKTVTKSSDALKEGRAQIKEYADENQKVLQTLNTLIEETDRIIKANNTTSGMDIPLFIGFRSTFDPKVPPMREFRDLETQNWVILDGLLKLLQDNPTLWEWQDGTMPIHCKDDTFQKKVMALIARAQANGMRQNFIRQQLLSTQPMHAQPIK